MSGLNVELLADVVDVAAPPAALNDDASLVFGSLLFCSVFSSLQSALSYDVIMYSYRFEYD